MNDNGSVAARAASYLRFDVNGLSGPVTSARLRVYVTNGTVDGPPAFAVAETAWGETAVTWTTRPPTGPTFARARRAVAARSSS